jgi:hypothetical protein
MQQEISRLETTWAISQGLESLEAVNSATKLP